MTVRIRGEALGPVAFMTFSVKLGSNLDCLGVVPLVWWPLTCAMVSYCFNVDSIAFVRASDDLVLCDKSLAVES